jgi:phosphoglycerate dehydrogenase-like enzyme
VQSFDQHFSTSDALVRTIGTADIVVIMRERTPFDRAVFDRLPRLKLLVTTGMKNAAVDLEAAKAHHVTVLGTEGSSRATTELTWALILGAARSLVAENLALRSKGQWQNTLGTELYGKTLGLLGLGRIGSQVAQIGLAFGMKVMAWSQHLTAERAQALSVQWAPSLYHLLQHSDFVSVHLQLSERTRGLIGSRELEQMKPSAYLINTSRGPIVDESALKSALSQGTIAGAGLDVFEVEPLPDDHAFRSLHNVLATPHIGYVSYETYRNWYPQIVEDIESYLAGQSIRQLI